MKLVSFVAIKGGVGKTTLALLTGQYLAQKGNKVLFIDLDHQCNLSHFYNIYQDSQTVSNIFTGVGDVSILSIAPNIDLIPGSMRLDEAERKLETNPNQNMRLYDWLDDNYDSRNLEQIAVQISVLQLEMLLLSVIQSLVQSLLVILLLRPKKT